MASNFDENETFNYTDLDNTLQAEKYEPVSQDGQEYNYSQIPPNQEIYEQLDQALINQPRDIYIEKLIEQTQENEGYLECYRRLLYDRACTIEGFPRGRLISRRDTSKSKSTSKLASDCFIIQMFIAGDHSEIDSIFSKSVVKTESEPSQAEPILSYVLSNDIASIKANIHSANSKIETLEKKVQKLESEVKDKDNTIKKLKEKLDSTSLKASRLDDEQGTKFAQLDAWRKSTNTILRSIDQFDNNVNEHRLKTIESNINSLCGQVTTCNRNIQKMSTSRENGHVNENIETVDLTTKQTAGNKSDTNVQSKLKVTQQSYKSLFPNNAKDLPRSDQRSISENDDHINSQSKEKRNTLYSNNDQQKSNQPSVSEVDDHVNPQSTEKRDTSSNNDVRNDKPQLKSGQQVENTGSLQPQNNKQQSKTAQQNGFTGAQRSRINKPQFINSQQSGSQRSETGGYVFVGAKRKKTTQFYIGNIDESSTYQGISDFLYENKFHPRTIRLFKTKSGVFAARVNIPCDEADYMYDIEWPENIIVKKWLSKHEMQQQFTNKSRGHNSYKRSGYTEKFYGDSRNYESHRYSDTHGYDNSSDYRDYRDHSDSREYSDWHGYGDSQGYNDSNDSHSYEDSHEYSTHYDSRSRSDCDWWNEKRSATQVD